MSSLQSLDTDMGDTRLYSMQRDTSLDRYITLAQYFYLIVSNKYEK